MIGIFDSGVGGLTVVKELRRQLPRASFIYLGDNARTPYGNRGQEIIQKYSAEDADFLLAKGVTAIVVACNTASALAGDYLKQKYQVPIFEVVAPAAQAAVSGSAGRIGVIGTRGTIGSGAYEKAIISLNPAAKVFSQGCPLLVPLAEEHWFDRAETKMIIRGYLQSLKMKDIDTLILGCTHYPLLKKAIRAKIGARVKLIDPAEEVIKKLADYLRLQPPVDEDQIQEFYATDPAGRFKEIGESWLKEKIDLKKADL
ncbi:MAG: glutamate racemase [Patescibacteria group bacterium]